MTLHRLLPLFDRARLSNEPLVLATVIRTGGSTYAKPGALMLIAADGEYAGLLSGGCLEGDLREHARGVAADGEARIVSYDLRSSTDQLFGLGAGCEGAMDILLTRLTAAEGWQPMSWLSAAHAQGRTERLAFVVASRQPGFPLGRVFRAEDPAAHGDVDTFVADFRPPPRVLLLGGGPDARPVATLGEFLGWRVTVVDHRPAYLSPEKFPAGTQLVDPDGDVAARVDLDTFAAAVVMSHHLDSDLRYLRALAASAVPYVGLLGPPARREKLLADLGPDAPKLQARLRAPVGLDIGGRAPESIALSIVGEIHAVMAGRSGQPFSSIA